MAFSNFLGYDRGENGELVLNEEQAAVVRRIYGLFLQGRSPYAIAKLLTGEGIPTPSGKETWCGATVKSILQNEKYKGDALLQKRYTVDFLSKKKKINKGEVPQYYVEGSHDAIIEPSVFDAVQKQMAVRHPGKNRHSSVSIFSSKIKCGDCGGWYGSKVWHSNDKYRRVVWQCNHKFDGGEKCATPHLDEERIKELFLKAANIFCAEKDEVLAGFEAVKDTVFATVALEEEKAGLQEEMNVVAGLIQQCINENARVALDQTEYQAKYNALADRFEKAKERLETVSMEITEKQARREMAEQCLAEIAKQEGVVSEFDEDLWYALVDYATVHGKNDVRFTFKDGTEIKV